MPASYHRLAGRLIFARGAPLITRLPPPPAPGGAAPAPAADGALVFPDGATLALPDGADLVMPAG